MLTFDFQKIDLNKNASLMLDIGCGEGRHIFGAMENFPDINCIGIDMDEPSIAKAVEGPEYFKSISNAHVDFIKGSAYSLPFNDDSADLIVCSEVLEHLREYEEAVKEIDRVLKPGGVLLISVPSYLPEKICWLLSNDYQNMPGGHLRIFKKNSLAKLIKKFDYRLLSSERFHALHSPYWWLRCIFWKTQDTNKIIALYKKVLEKQILEKPVYLEIIDKLMNPFLGKSLSLYFRKEI